MQFLIHVEIKDRPKASTGSSKFSYDDARLILALERRFEESFMLKIHLFVNKFVYFLVFIQITRNTITIT